MRTEKNILVGIVHNASIIFFDNHPQPIQHTNCGALKSKQIPKGLQRQSEGHPACPGPVAGMGNGSSGQHPYGNLVQSSGWGATCLGCVVIILEVDFVMKELVMVVVEVVVVVEIVVVVASNSHKYYFR